MTYDGLFCHHEGVDGKSSLSEYSNIFNDNIGDSNTGLSLFNFKPYIPEGTKVVIIDNDIKSSVDFAKKEYGLDNQKLMEIMKDRLESIDGLHIQFSEINNNLEEIWSYITDKPFNYERAEMLKDMNIQVMDIHNIDTKSMSLLLENNKDDYLT